MTLSTVALLATAMLQEPVPTTLPEYLSRQGFTRSDLESIETGQAVVRLLDSETDTETRILGVVKIRGKAEDFIARYRDIVSFEKGAGVLQIGLFSDPAKVSDVEGLTLDAQDFEDLKKCKPGDCDIKLSDPTIQAFQRLDWNAEDAFAQAQRLARQMIVDFVNTYREGGNAALSIFHDKKHPLLVERQFEAMIANRDLIAYFPRLHAFLKDYPKASIPGAEELFYWSKVDFGLKPVVRLNHVVIYRPEGNEAVRYAVASKMIYTTHYFNTGLELKFLVASPDSPNAYYLVSVNQSRSDGLTGFVGALIGGKIRAKARDGLESYLALVKGSLQQ